MDERDRQIETLKRRLETEAGRPQPTPAVTIAAWLGLSGHRESRRRQVRKLVHEARNSGFRVCAESRGYWLARSDAEWHAYGEAVKRGAIYRFVALAKQRKAANETQSGQGKLFNLTPVFVG